MEYRAISADGHVNEPPTLWHGQLAGEVQGARSPGHRDAEHQGPRLDHGGPEAAVADGLLLDVLPGVEAIRPGVAGRQLQADQGPRRPLRGRVPRLVRSRGAGEGDHRGRDRRRGDLQRRADGVERHQALPGPRAEPRLLSRSTTTGSPSSRPTRPERFICNGTLPTTGIERRARGAAALRRHGSAHGAARVVPERVVLGALAGGRPLLGGGRRDRHADQRAHAVLLPGRRPRFEDRRPRAFRSRRNAPRSSASTSPRRASRRSSPG